MEQEKVSWNEKISESLVLHWLAQCKRRLIYPLDSSEEVGLSGFEYGWKAFNAIYKLFPGTHDKEKITVCISSLLIDKDEFLNTVRSNMRLLCSYCSTGEIKIKNYNDRKNANELCESLEVAIENNNAFSAIKYLVKILYLLRNTRVHSDFGTFQPGQSGKTSPLSVLPIIILELCSRLLSGKLKMKLDSVEEIIDDRVSQLIEEIRGNISKPTNQY